MASDRYENQHDIQQTLGLLPQKVLDNPVGAIHDIHRLTQIVKEDPSLAYDFVHHGAEALKKIAPVAGYASVILLEHMTTAAGEHAGMKAKVVDAGCDIFPIAAKKWREENTVTLLRDIIEAAGDSFSRTGAYQETFFTAPDVHGEQIVYYRADVNDTTLHRVSGIFKNDGIAERFNVASREQGAFPHIQNDLNNPLLAHALRHDLYMNMRK